jgi:cytochrome c-type biogenesis protein CcmH/NrfG
MYSPSRMMNASFPWGGRKMELSSHGTAGSRLVLLVAGFATSVTLVTVLVLNARSAVDEPQPLTAVASEPAYDYSGLPDDTAIGFSHPTPIVTKVSSLQELLPGLEARVATNPQDIDSRILLAQTYAELGQAQKGQELMTKLQREFPGNSRVPFARAKVLMAGTAPADLRRAIHLFEESALDDPTTVHLARLHQGHILLKLGDRERARQIWRDYIATLPAGDERRTLIESELAHIPPS